MKTRALRVVVVLLLYLLVVPALGWSQADDVHPGPASFGLAGDAQGRHFDPDPRFDPAELLALASADDEEALRALLLDAPSAYALTRGLILTLLTEKSSAMLHQYAFELGQPDPDLSGLELTALLNSPLSERDLRALARWPRLLENPDLIGAGALAEQRRFDLISLNNELRDQGLDVRQRVALSGALRKTVLLDAARQEAFVALWLPLVTSLAGQAAGGVSQLLSAVARDDGVSTEVKRRLIAGELGVRVVQGFSSGQYGAIYIVLKAVSPGLRNVLQEIVTLGSVNPNQSPFSDIAGLYRARQIALKTSLDPDAIAGVLEHELGHLAWATQLGLSQQGLYRQLHAQSQKRSLDFVSDYAETNVNEDFAETFQAYMQSTPNWLERSAKDDVLRQKFVVVASVLAPYVYLTQSGLSGPAIRRAGVPFRRGLPDLSAVQWQVL